MIDTENMRQSHRFGRTLAELHRAADLEVADEGGIAPLREPEPFEPVPLTRMRPTWNGWPWWLLALSVGGLIAWAVVEWVA